MKSIIAAFAVLPILAACYVVKSEIREEHPEQSAQAFDVLKSLAGKWHGDATDGTNQFPVDVTYELTSKGTVVMERLFPGTEDEMVSMYHRDGAKLLLTHYCSMGNQPRMELVGFSYHQEKTLSFSFLDATNWSDPKNMVMHDMRLSVIDPNHIAATWTAFADGKAGHVGNFSFKRLP